MVKIWLTPWVWQTRISPTIFLKIQHAHGQKMIDPLGMTDQDLSYNFFKDSTCTWSQDDWPPITNQDLT